MSENPDVLGLEGHVIELANGEELEILFTPRRMRQVENTYHSLPNFMTALRDQPIQNLAWVIALHRLLRGGAPGPQHVDSALDLIAPARLRSYIRAVSDAVADGLGGSEPEAEFHMHLEALLMLARALDVPADDLAARVEELRAMVLLPPQTPLGRSGRSTGPGTSTSPSPSSTSTPAPSGIG